MKKKNKPKYVKAIPMLVYRTINETDLETAEYMAVHAFAHGFAQKSHFDKLVDLMNLMLVAGQTDKSRKYLIDYIDAKIKPVLGSIKKRYEQTNKLGVNGTELQELRNMLQVNKDFWLKQSGSLYTFCIEQVNLFYDERKNARKVES